MNSNTQICCMCSTVVEASKRISPSIKELLNFLILIRNFQLLEESAVCETCLTKIQSAYKFKTLYFDGLQKTLTEETIKEEINPEKCIRCEICKTTNQSDYIPLFGSVTENGFNLIKYLSADLESKIQDKSLTCETCHKSLINFYDITNLLTVFNPNRAVIINESSIEIDDKEIQEIDHDLSHASSNTNFKDDFKVEIDLKKEEFNNFHEELVLKSEEVDLKMESDDDSQLSKQKNDNETETTSLLNCINFKSENETYPVTGILKYQNCEFKTKHESALDEHVFVHKNSDNLKMYKCHICQYKTNRKDILKMHIRQHSHNVAKLKCLNCDYTTKYTSHLKQHMVVHKSSDEIEMYKCQSCDFETKYKNTLKQHMLIHKNSEEVEMSKCQICDYQTKYKYNLKKHMLVHKLPQVVEMLKCQKCEFKTKRKSCLKQHIHYIHDDSNKVEILKCPNCDYETKYKSSLKNHMLLHKNTDEVKMFKCHICDYETKNKYYLTKHMLRYKNSVEAHISHYKTKRKLDLSTPL